LTGQYDAPDSADTSETGRQVHALLAGWKVEAGEDALGLTSRFPESELGWRAAETMLVEREYSFLFELEGTALNAQMTCGSSLMFFPSLPIKGVSLRQQADL